MKDINLKNVTFNTGSLTSIWPTGDYKVIVSITTLATGTEEDFVNITLIGNFRTPLKESFG